MNLTNTNNILVLDDDPDITEILNIIINGYRGHNIVGVKTIKEALTALENNYFCSVFVDLNLKKECGMTFVKTFRDKDKDTPVILMSTSFEDQDKTQKLFSLDVDRILIKPLSSEAVLYAMDNAFELSKKREKYKKLLVEKENSLEILLQRMYEIQDMLSNPNQNVVNFIKMGIDKLKKSPNMNKAEKTLLQSIEKQLISIFDLIQDVQTPPS